MKVINLIVWRVLYISYQKKIIIIYIYWIDFVWNFLVHRCKRFIFLGLFFCERIHLFCFKVVLIFSKLCVLWEFCVLLLGWIIINFVSVLPCLHRLDWPSRYHASKPICTEHSYFLIRIFMFTYWFNYSIYFCFIPTLCIFYHQIYLQGKHSITITHGLHMFKPSQFGHTFTRRNTWHAFLIQTAPQLIIGIIILQIRLPIVIYVNSSFCNLHNLHCHGP